MLDEKDITRAISFYSKEAVDEDNTNKHKKDSIYCLGIVTGLMIALGRSKEFLDSFYDEDGWLGYSIKTIKEIHNIE